MIPDLDKKIIAYALSDKRFALDLQTTVPVEYIHIKAQTLYSMVIKSFSKHHDIPTSRILLESFGRLFDEGNKEAFEECEKIEINDKEFNHDLDILKTRYNKQILLDIGKKVYQENYNGSDFKNLEEANKELQKLSSSIDGIHKIKVFSEGSLKDSVKKSWEEYKTARDNPELVRGIMTGIRDFDRLTNGLKPAELLLIGGESNSGKSIVSMNIGLNAWLGSNNYPDSPDGVDMSSLSGDGVDVLFFSLEMKEQPLRRRCNACLAGVPSNGIRDGSLNAEEEARFKTALKFTRDYDKQFHIIDIPRGCNMAMLESKYIEMCLEYNPQLIVLDYITLMSADNNDNDWLAIGHLAEKLHEFGRYHDIAVVSPVQLNRPPKNNSGSAVADQHRVGRSNMLVQNCDMLLNIETRSEEELRQDMVIRIAKMRDAAKGSFQLMKRFDIMRILSDIPDWGTVDLYDGYQGAKDGYK